jgi:hypothetical protein
MRDERGGGSEREKVSVRFWWETFAPLPSFDHLVVLRAVIHVSNGEHQHKQV